MPLHTLGSIKTSPIPATMQADVPTPATTDWANVKSSDKTSYSVDDLVDDIISPFGSLISPLATDYHSMGNNGIISGFISMFKEKTTLASEKQGWFDKWEDAFQHNPTFDISHEISEMVRKGLGTIGDKTGWMDQAINAPAGDKALLAFIKTGMDNLMSGLKSKMPAFIDKNLIKSEMDKLVTDELAKFKLVPADEGLDDINRLSSEAVAQLTDSFKNAKYQTSTPNRPYRIYNQVKATEDAMDAFKAQFHTQEIADKITDAALQKATKGSSVKNKDGDTIENLETILGHVSKTNLDSRFVDSMADIKPIFGDDIPVEIYEKLYGKVAGDEFVKWYNQWKWLLKSSFKGTYDKDTSTYSVEVDTSVRSGVDIIDAEGSSYQAFKSSKLSDVKQVIDDIPVESISYMTDLFAKDYAALIHYQVSKDASISEDELVKLFGGTPVDSDFKEGVTVDQLMTLDPETFGVTKDHADLKSMVEKEFTTIENNFKDLYPAFKYDRDKVGITFKITYSQSKSGKLVIIVPKISDGNVATMPAIEWAKNTVVPSGVQTQVDKIFTDKDDAHESKDYGDFDNLPQKVVSPLDSAVTRAYNIFKNYKLLNGDEPFEMDIVGGLGENDIIPVLNFEGTYKGMKEALDKFDSDLGSRFSIEYTIKKLDKDHVQISYEVTDTKNTETATKTPSGEELDNINIVFNKSLDKGQSWLDKLQKDKIDKSDFQTHAQVEAFGKRNPLELTADELHKAFSTFEALKAAALKEGVTLEAKEVEEVSDSKGESTYLQKFTAEFLAADGIKVVSHFIKLQFTHNFLSQQEIDEAKDEIDKDAGDAKETIAKSSMSDEDKNMLTDETEKTRQFLHDEITKHGSDMSEEKLRAVETISNKMPAIAQAAAMKAKYDEVHGMLEKEFPNGVPPEVEELFKKNWESFEQIIKNDPSILHDISKLKDLLKNVSVDKLMNAQKTMQKSGKIALMALGGLLGMGGLLGGANAVKVATTNKKAVNARTGKIKSSKKLAAISALIGLASVAGSIGTFVYLFVVQGGL